MLQGVGHPVYMVVYHAEVRGLMVVAPERDEARALDFPGAVVVFSPAV